MPSHHHTILVISLHCQDFSSLCLALCYLFSARDIEVLQKPKLRAAHEEVVIGQELEFARFQVIPHVMEFNPLIVINVQMLFLGNGKHGLIL